MSYQFLILAAITAVRGWELQHSWRQMARGAKGAPLQRIEEPYLPLMAAAQFLWLGGCLVEVVLLRPLFHSWLVMAMLLLWAGALWLRFWAVVQLGAAWNLLVIRRRNQKFTSGGPYRWVRHPYYLAVVIELLAVPVLVGAYWSALLWVVPNLLALAERMRREEAYLFRSAAYRREFAGRKRLIPGLW